MVYVGVHRYTHTAMEHKPSESQLFSILSDLMSTEPCRALPCFSRAVLFANHNVIHLQSPDVLSGLSPVQAGSLLEALGHPADAGLYWGLCSPPYNAEK